MVARTVREYERQEHLEEGTAIRREILSELFREHLQKMEQAAWWLLELTGHLSLRECCFIPRNEFISFEKPNIESALANRIMNMLAQSRKGKTTAISVDNIAENVRSHVLQREAKAVVEDLKEHLPDLWGKVNTWEEEAAKYLDRWRILDEHPRKKGIPSHLLAPGIKEAQRLLALTGEVESSPKEPDKCETPEDVGLWLFRNPTVREALDTIGDSYDNLRAAFEELEDMLIPSGVRRSLLKRKCTHCPMP